MRERERERERGREGERERESERERERERERGVSLVNLTACSRPVSAVVHAVRNKLEPFRTCPSPCLASGRPCSRGVHTGPAHTASAPGNNTGAQGVAGVRAPLRPPS